MTKHKYIISTALLLSLLALNAGAQERTLSLEECLSLSHSGNNEVLNSALDTQIARAQRQEALSLWFPTVSASAYGLHAMDPLLRIGVNDIIQGNSDAANNLRYYINSISSMTGLSTEVNLLQKGFLGSVNVSQPLFAGGRIANGNALAKLGVKAADVKSNMAVRDNDVTVALKYWTIISLTEKKKALQQAIDLLCSLEKDVTSAVEAGLARESDLMQVKLKKKELETDMLKLKSGEKLAKMDLFNYIGLVFNVLNLDSIVLSDGFDGILPPENYYADEAAVAESLEESKLLDMAVSAKKIEKKMAIGEALPEVGIGASLGYGKVVGEPRTNGIAFAMIKIPLSDWGRTARRIQRFNYEISKAENDKSYLGKQLLLKVSKEWIDLQCAWQQTGIAEDAAAVASTLEMQKREEYAAGLCTVSELLQCQTELQTARSSLVDAQASYCSALAQWNSNAR
ncbi:MAG: TolC family protein [Bacteroidales bacterium]|nr:TolC family protein [Candidatus Cacconaster merdequi]